jgi:putative PIN family toxin of toxin-antitoxin system
LLRAVLDTNVVVSAFIRPAGPPGQILERLLQGEFVLVTCEAMVDELRRTLLRPSVRKYLRVSQRELAGRVVQLEALADVVEGNFELELAVRDPDDRIFLAAAVEGRADYLVSGDSDLLAVAQYDNVHVVTPRIFLDRLKGDATAL